VTTIVNRQVTHLTRLVDDLLDISRITNGKTELQRERVPLSAVLAHAVEICMPLLERGGHRIEVDQPETPVARSRSTARSCRASATCSATPASSRSAPA
jgi:signal transduction histidine kinase